MKKLGKCAMTMISKAHRSSCMALLLITLASWGCATAPTPATPQTGALSGPVIQIARPVIDLGRIPADRHEILGELPFSNPGSEPLQIRDVSGADTSFAGFTGTRFVSPGDKGKLQIKFNTARIPTGPTRRRVTIETNDPKHPRMQIYFSFDLRRNAAEEQLWILKTELSALRDEVRTLRRDLDTVLRTRAEVKKTTPQRQQPQRTVAACDVNVGSSPVLGPNDAPVTIVEFIDFQCPYCVREWPKIKQMTRQYPDKVRVVFKHFPLRFHFKAKPAHAAAELAHRHGGPKLFWKMHDMIMDQPKKLDIADLREHANALNMDLARFDEVMADPKKINELLTADITEAQKCGVRGTPTILINGSKLTNRSIAAYKTRIDQILTARQK